MSDRHSLLRRFRTARAATDALIGPLQPEDTVVQSMPDVSPTKWHAAHTTWFFETFVLERFEPSFQPHHESFRVLFNSYYNGVGEQYSRADRGLLSRPTLDETKEYRSAITRRVLSLLEACPDSDLSEISSLIEVGIHHEQQHQELLLTDILHVFSVNPLEPTYREGVEIQSSTHESDWLGFSGGMLDVGHPGDGFSFDNECPRHAAWIRPFELRTHPVTCGEWAAFIDDDGYRRPELWHSAGWAAVTENDWRAPLYWRQEPDGWTTFTLHGRREIDPAAPVTHVSWFEASAFAAWANARLPSEQEWETASARTKSRGNFVESGWLEPALQAEAKLAGMLGSVWEWTSSSYDPYPGYCAAPGALGEYNGKFMCGQYVLRGGSCLTPESHIRPSYRNFFPPEARWQFSGLRLARSGG